MKTRKILLVALAVGAAVAGLAALAFTEEGKKVSRKWKKKGERIRGHMEEIVSEAKNRFEGLAKEFASECKKKEGVGQE